MGGAVVCIHLVDDGVDIPAQPNPLDAVDGIGYVVDWFAHG